MWKLYITFALFVVTFGMACVSVGVENLSRQPRSEMVALDQKSALNLPSKVQPVSRTTSLLAILGGLAISGIGIKIIINALRHKDSADEVGLRGMIFGALDDAVEKLD